MPVGIAALLIGWFALTLPRKRNDRPIDYAGIAVLSVATTSLILFTDLGGPRAGRPGRRSALLAALFVVGRRADLPSSCGRRTDHPPVPVPQPDLRGRHGARRLVGLGMFSAIAFVPTFLQMSSGLSAAGSGLLMLPMVGRNHRDHPEFRVVRRAHRPVQDLRGRGVLVIAAAMVWLTTLSGSTSLWVVGAMLFALGAGLGLIMQNVVLAAQNAVSAGSRHGDIDQQLLPRGRRHPRGGDLRHAVHQPPGGKPGRGAPANAEQAVEAGITSPDSLVPGRCSGGREPLRTAIVDGYAGALAPVFWYLLPLLLVGGGAGAGCGRSRCRKSPGWWPGARAGGCGA